MDPAIASILVAVFFVVIGIFAFVKAFRIFGDYIGWVLAVGLVFAIGGLIFDPEPTKACILSSIHAFQDIYRAIVSGLSR